MKEERRSAERKSRAQPGKAQVIEFAAEILKPAPQEPSLGNHETRETHEIRVAFRGDINVVSWSVTCGLGVRLCARAGRVTADEGREAAKPQGSRKGRP